jgi:hypothetical protein
MLNELIMGFHFATQFDGFFPSSAPFAVYLSTYLEPAARARSGTAGSP